VILKHNTKLSNIDFIKKSYEFTKIIELKKDVNFRFMIAGFIARTSLLAGIKEPISDIIKQDIYTMLCNYWNNISMEDIVKAFEMERFSRFKERTEHYQMFDTTYISNVLKKYLEWKTSTKMEYKIEPPKQNTEISEIEKSKIRDNFLKAMYDDLVSDKFSNDAWQLFFDFEKDGKIKASNLEKKILYKTELSIYIPAQKEEIRMRSKGSAKHLLSDFQKRIDSGNPITYVQNRCRSILVSECLLNHLTDFIEFKNFIDAKTNIS